MDFPALMMAQRSPLSPVVLSPNDGRRAFARTRTLLLLAVCALALVVTGGCNKSMKGGQVNIQKICTFQMTATESEAIQQEHDWNMDMDECVIIMDTENEG